MNEIIEELVRKIVDLERRIDYLETVELIGEWTDYSNTSTITGWSAYTTKLIYYKIVGKLMFVSFNIDGTSDADVAYFTIPETISNDPSTAAIGLIAIPVEDNGTPTIGMVFGNRNTSNVISIPSATSAYDDWTTSGDKQIRGSLWFQIQ